ncbi:peptidyl-tRNA hydrolase, PTH2 family, partial [Pancytospora epiphaga]
MLSIKFSNDKIPFKFQIIYLAHMGYLFWIGTAVLAIGAVSLLRSFFTKKKKSSKSVSAFPEGEYQMVVIINTDFKMSKGKVLSQFGHAIDAAHRQLRKNLDLEHAWRKSGSAKIALKGNT